MPTQEEFDKLIRQKNDIKSGMEKLELVSLNLVKALEARPTKTELDESQRALRTAIKILFVLTLLIGVGSFVISNRAADISRSNNTVLEQLNPESKSYAQREERRFEQYKDIAEYGNCVMERNLLEQFIENYPDNDFELSENCKEVLEEGEG